MVKFLIGVVFILGLTQEKSEAVDLDSMLLIKEIVEVSKKYNTCTSIEDDKKRLACFDSLTNYIKKREKIYNKHETTKDKVSAEFRILQSYAVEWPRRKIPEVILFYGLSS